MLHIVKNTIRHFTIHKDNDVNVYVLHVSACRSALSHTLALDCSIVAVCIYSMCDFPPHVIAAKQRDPDTSSSNKTNIAR